MVSAQKKCGENLSRLLLKKSKFAIKRNFFIAAKITTTKFNSFFLYSHYSQPEFRRPLFTRGYSLPWRYWVQLSSRYHKQRRRRHFFISFKADVTLTTAGFRSALFFIAMFYHNFEHDYIISGLKLHREMAYGWHLKCGILAPTTLLK